MVDTGCGNDLIDASRLKGQEGHVRDAETAFTLRTANGDIEVSKQIKVLEHRLHRALVKFNEAIAANKDLREEIDNLRRERVVFDGRERERQPGLGVGSARHPASAHSRRCVVEW